MLCHTNDTLFELIDFAKGRDNEEVALIRCCTELGDVIIEIP